MVAGGRKERPREKIRAETVIPSIVSRSEANEREVADLLIYGGGGEI